MRVRETYECNMADDGVQSEIIERMKQLAILSTDGRVTVVFELNTALEPVRKRRTKEESSK